MLFQTLGYGLKRKKSYTPTSMRVRDRWGGRSLIYLSTILKLEVRILCGPIKTMSQISLLTGLKCRALVNTSKTVPRKGKNCKINVRSVKTSGMLTANQNNMLTKCAFA